MIDRNVMNDRYDSFSDSRSLEIDRLNNKTVKIYN